MEALSVLMGLGGVTVVVLIGLVLLLAVVWVLVPFAVFGLKRRVDAATLELQRANRLLQSIERQLAESSNGPETDRFIL